MHEEDLDRLIRGAALKPPDDFVAHVMRRIEVPRAALGSPCLLLLRRLALIAGSALAAVQAAAFAFSVWSFAGVAF
jgi:hypothetical protein